MQNEARRTDHPPKQGYKAALPLAFIGRLPSVPQLFPQRRTTASLRAQENPPGNSLPLARPVGGKNAIARQSRVRPTRLGLKTLLEIFSAQRRGNRHANG